MSFPVPEPLSEEDARILALEDGAVRGHTCKVVLLAEPRDVAAIRERVGARLDREPRLAVRLQAGEAPAWVPDTAVDLALQVRDGGPVAAGELAGAVAELMAERLPRDRPLWALDAVAVDDGTTALVWRIHHALADGSTAMRMIRRVLLDDESAAGGDSAAPARGEGRVAHAGEAAAGPGSAATTPAREAAVSAPATASRLAPLRRALHVPAALHRELTRRGDATVLDATAGERRAVAFVDVPLAEVKRIAHALPERATVNDVVLAAVAGGLRAWLEGLDAHPAALRVKVPVSLHQPGDEAGNRDSFIFVDLPLTEDDPVRRLRAVAAETRERKRDHDAETLDSFFRDLGHVSSSLERFAEHWAQSPRVFTLNVSNVPGPRGALSVLGAPVAALHSLAEIAHRHALRVAVVSASGTIGFGLCADADAVGSPEPIAAGVGAELAALGAALR